MQIEKKLILASGSPRRREMLSQLGLSFTVCPACGEEVLHTSVPAEAVKSLALQKAAEIAAKTEEPALVIGSDTVVACDGEILGKPRDEADAFRMLFKLQGRAHTVYTGVAVIDTEQQETLVLFEDHTAVQMYPMSEAQIRAYIATGEPMDKAGSYAIQGLCAPFIQGIQGDYHTVVGFPLARCYQELLGVGIDLFDWRTC